MPGPVPCRATWKLKKMCWILVPAVRTAKATSWCAFHSAPSSQHALLDSQGHRSIAWRNRLTPPEIWKHMETENITTNHLSYLSITSSHRASTQQLDSLDMCFDMCFDMCWPSSPCHLLPLLPFHSSSPETLMCSSNDWKRLAAQLSIVGERLSIPRSSAPAWQP